MFERSPQQMLGGFVGLIAELFFLVARARRRLTLSHSYGDKPGAPRCRSCAGVRIVATVTRALGVVCERAGIHYTFMTAPGAATEVESEISVPTSQTDRGAELSWLLEQAEELLRRLRPDVLYVKKSPGGQRQSSREQHEVEAVVQVAAHRTSVACAIRTTEQVRAAHAPKGKGAYKQLLEREDVKARGNRNRRESYLYASTALSEQSAEPDR